MRLIDADALRAEIQEYVLPITTNNLMGAADAYYRILHLLDGAPTIDAVPVARCKECRYCAYDEIFGQYWCNRMNATYKVKPDDFCSYGECKRRSE